MWRAYVSAAACSWSTDAKYTAKASVRSGRRYRQIVGVGDAGVRRRLAPVAVEVDHPVDGLIRIGLFKRCFHVPHGRSPAVAREGPITVRV